MVNQLALCCSLWHGTFAPIEEVTRYTERFHRRVTLRGDHCRIKPQAWWAQVCSLVLLLCTTEFLTSFQVVVRPSTTGKRPITNGMSEEWPEELAELLSHCPGLRSLDFSGLVFLTDTTLIGILLSCLYLERLDLSGMARAPAAIALLFTALHSCICQLRVCLYLRDSI